MYYRLKKNSDFKKIFASGKKSFSSGLMMIFTNGSSLKIGISVSKKHGGSVKRNRLKRLIKAAFLELSGDVVGGYNIIFIPKYDYEHTFLSIKESIKRMLVKEGMFNKC